MIELPNRFREAIARFDATKVLDHIRYFFMGESIQKIYFTRK